MTSVDGATAFQTAISELAAEVRAKWAVENFDVGRLPSVALKILAQASLVKNFSLEAWADWLGGTESKPEQVRDPAGGRGFSTILYRDPGEKFVIEASCRTDRETSIHDHGFSGASVLVQGKTLNVGYRFEERSVISRYVRQGALVPQEVHLRKTAEPFGLYPGALHIHQIWPLTLPAVTLDVRTATAHHPSFRYLPPGLAIRADAASDGLIGKQIAWQRFLDAVAPAQAQSFRQLLFRESEPPSVIQLALEAFASELKNSRTYERPPAIHDWLYGVQDRFSWAANLHEAAGREWASHALALSQTTEEPLRLFLALLTTFGFGRELDAQLRRLYPGQDLKSLFGDRLERLAENEGAPAAPLRFAAKVATWKQKKPPTEAELEREKAKYLVEPPDLLLAELWRVERLAQGSY